MPDQPKTNRPSELRPVGLGKGLVEIPDSFFDPLPEELLRLFEGKDDQAVTPNPSQPESED